MSQADFLLHSTYARGTPEQIGTRHGEPIVSCLRKQPVQEAMTRIGPEGLMLDGQADRSVHGGLSKAFYAWPMDNYRAWAAQSDVDLWADATIHDPYHGGHFGENLLVEGSPYLDEEQVRQGDLWAWGSCFLEVTVPREPCYKLVAALPGAAQWMLNTGRCGWYLSLAGGDGGVVPAYGTPLQLLQLGSGPTIAELFRAKKKRNQGRVHGIPG